MATNKLTEIAISQAKPSEKPCKLTDGGGMYLLVDTKGGKYWRLDYRFAEKRKTLALGIYPEQSLKEARSTIPSITPHHRTPQGSRGFYCCNRHHSHPLR